MLPAVASGADVEEVVNGMGLDHRIGHHFFGAGIGYGSAPLAIGFAVSNSDHVMAMRPRIRAKSA